jgi:hypothetical protein
MTIPPSQRSVGEDELRRLFNNNRYWERLQDGEFTQSVRRRKHLGAAKPDLPLCTHSEVLEYRDKSSQQIAVVHQYVRPDGTIGGSGKPDPKMVRVGDIIYILKPPVP